MDLATVLIIAAVMMLLNGSVLGLIHASLSAEVQGSARDWRRGTLLMAVGTLALAAQRQLPMPPVITAATVIILVALTLYTRSIRRFHGADGASRGFLLLWANVALTVAATAWFSFAQPNLGARVAAASLGALAPLAAGLWCMWPHRHALVTTRVLIGLYSLIMLVMLFRTASAMRMSSAEYTLLDSPHPAQALGILLASALPVVGTTVFALMCLERARQHWKQAASVDALTGVANRAALQRAAPALLAAARAPGQTLVALAIDVDHFKAVNDRHGHGVGDRALVHVAQRLAASLPPAALLARYGGEEFVALLPWSSASEAPDIGGPAEATRLAVASQPMPMREGQQLPLTVSVGAVLLSPADGDVDALLRRADAALYAAKAAGRNRVMVGDAGEAGAVKPPAPNAAT